MQQSNCSYCNKQFFPANATTKLCSDECRRESRLRTARNSRNYVHAPKVETVCEQCGETFISKKAGTKMCSDLCRSRNSSKTKRARIAKNRKCIRCGVQCEPKPGIPVCLDCRIDKRDPVKGSEKERRRRFRKYGISEEQYLQMISDQGGRCAICMTNTPSSKGWQIDHCHTTGRVRGVLCMYCNTGLGSFADDIVKLQSAIRYLSANS